MKTVKIQDEMFKKILDGTKHCLSKDGRKQLEYIRIEIKADSIVAYALDGFRAGKVVITCKEKNTDEFVCYIKPFPVKVSKGNIGYVTLALDDENAESKRVYAEVDTEYGKLRYCFEQNGLDWTVNIEDIYANAKIHDREIAVNSNMIAQMFKALSVVTNDRNNLCVIESKDSRLQAFCISAEAPDLKCEQLILPIRRAGDER